VPTLGMLGQHWLLNLLAILTEPTFAGFGNHQRCESSLHHSHRRLVT